MDVIQGSCKPRTFRCVVVEGQWSIDIMEKKSVKDYAEMSKDSEDDFYIIDMALAAQSAFSERFKDVLKPVQENWLPTIE